MVCDMCICMCIYTAYSCNSMKRENTLSIEGKSRERQKKSERKTERQRERQNICMCIEKHSFLKEIV